MIIDNSVLLSDETIVLYPRAYNKRGEERLHSVQGISVDGSEVNIKLRIDESLMGKESTPSIAEFSREDVKAKHPCLASEENGPHSREGVLLFTGCEFDGENRRKIPTYTARWGYVLASHSDASEPLFGLGRVVIDTESFARKKLQAEIDDIEREKAAGWEAIVAHKKRQMDDPFQQSYYGQLYDYQAEKTFEPDSKGAIIEHAQSVFTSQTQNGCVGGVLIRLINGKGELFNEFSHEIFPRWRKGDTYQTAEQALSWFLSSNEHHLNEPECRLTLMPIRRYSCGAQFKNYYLQRKPEEAINKIKKNFLVNDRPTVSSVAFVFSKREDTEERYLAKFYPITSPLGAVSHIGIAEDQVKSLWADYHVAKPGMDSIALTLPDWVSDFIVPNEGMSISVNAEKLVKVKIQDTQDDQVLDESPDEDEYASLIITDRSTDMTSKTENVHNEALASMGPIETDQFSEKMIPSDEASIADDSIPIIATDHLLTLKLEASSDPSLMGPLSVEHVTDEVKQDEDVPAHVQMFESNVDEDVGLNFSDLDEVDYEKDPQIPDFESDINDLDAQGSEKAPHESISIDQEDGEQDAGDGNDGPRETEEVKIVEDTNTGLESFLKMKGLL